MNAWSHFMRIALVDVIKIKVNGIIAAAMVLAAVYATRKGIEPTGVELYLLIAAAVYKPQQIRETVGMITWPWWKFRSVCAARWVAFVLVLRMTGTARPCPNIVPKIKKMMVSLLDSRIYVAGIPTYLTKVRKR